MSATREAYVRASAEVYEIEVHIGVELREDDAVELLTRIVQGAASASLLGNGSHADVVLAAEETIKKLWPGRAYFIETDTNGRGVQVYQPFGMPRNTPASDGRWTTRLELSDCTGGGYRRTIVPDGTISTDEIIMLAQMRARFIFDGRECWGQAPVFDPIKHEIVFYVDSYPVPE